LELFPVRSEEGFARDCPPRHVHLLVKWSQQGNNALENLVTLCAHCHVAKHGQLFFESKAKATEKKRLENSPSATQSGLQGW
jgi:5-methylcytosine-specific restriction endonuclease McrA